MKANDHLCPWWIGYLLASPIRTWLQDPEVILGPHLREGMTALDVGCGMGFFSLPMARMVGATGRVVCVDVQQRMIDTLLRRARRRGLTRRLDARTCVGTDLGLDDLAGRVDFALAFAMVHEASDAVALMRQLHALVAPGGRLLVAEPRGHVEVERFDSELGLAADAGFKVESRPTIARSHAAVLRRP